MLLAALRRLLLLVLLASVVTTVVSLALGALTGASIDRAVSLGFYAVGCFLLVAGFFMGNRGPARVQSETGGWGIVPFFGSRRLRWATQGEQAEAINYSAVYVALGLILVVIGIAVDTRHNLI